MDSGLEGARASEQLGEQRVYLSYLLRLWRISCDDEAASHGHADSFHGIGRSVWRASLESPHTGERLGFGSLEDLFGFLRAQAGSVPVVDEGRRGKQG